MPRHFDPALVNDPFDDPGLYVDLAFERRALLFDVGDLGGLAPRKLLRVSDAFVTHLHMDHFAGFDQLLRRLLGREKVIGVHGPAGIINAVEHKLKAYTWNLIEGYDGNLTFRVTEIDEAGRLTTAQFSGHTRFHRFDGERGQSGDGLILKESRHAGPRGHAGPWRAGARFRPRGAGSNQRVAQQGRGHGARYRAMAPCIQGGDPPRRGRRRSLSMSPGLTPSPKSPPPFRLACSRKRS